MFRYIMAEDRRVNVQFLGIVEYHEAFLLMKNLQNQRMNDEIIDTMLILEHPEIVTIGPRARNDGITAPPSYPTYSVDRGGGLTWHGPGQIVVYPIFKWDFPGESSVAKIITLIEQWVIDSLANFEINCDRDERMQGVWLDGYKICSIGLSFLRWTSRHGFTINLNTPENRVENLAGCGLESSTTTCLQRLGHNLARDKVIDSLIDTMPKILNRSMV